MILFISDRAGVVSFQTNIPPQFSENSDASAKYMLFMIGDIKPTYRMDYDEDFKTVGYADTNTKKLLRWHLSINRVQLNFILCNIDLWTIPIASSW